MESVQLLPIQLHLPSLDELDGAFSVESPKLRHPDYPIVIRIGSRSLAEQSVYRRVASGGQRVNERHHLGCGKTLDDLRVVQSVDCTHTLHRRCTLTGLLRAVCPDSREREGL